MKRIKKIVVIIFFDNSKTGLYPLAAHINLAKKALELLRIGIEGSSMSNFCLNII